MRLPVVPEFRPQDSLAVEKEIQSLGAQWHNGLAHTSSCQSGI